MKYSKEYIEAYEEHNKAIIDHDDLIKNKSKLSANEKRNELTKARKRIVDTYLKLMSEKNLSLFRERSIYL